MATSFVDTSVHASFSLEKHNSYSGVSCGIINKNEERKEKLVNPAYGMIL